MGGFPRVEQKNVHIWSLDIINEITFKSTAVMFTFVLSFHRVSFITLGNCHNRDS